MKIKELPIEIQNRVYTLQIEAGNLPNGDLDLIAKKHEGNFDWHRTEESWEFWRRIYDIHFDDFYARYGMDYPDPRLKLQAKLKDTINDIIKDCPFTMSESNWDSLKDVLSIHLQKMLAK